MEIIHTSVLLQECLQYLAPDHGGSLMIDGTLGEGGHTEAFLTRYPDLHIIGIDADQKIQEKAKERLAQFGDRVSFYNGWSDVFFSEYPDAETKPDRILIDLGISLFHYEKSGRGFSFRSDEPLDMRLDPSYPQSAADLVNTMNETALADLIYQFGEERYSRRISKAICEKRGLSKFSTAKALADCIYSAVPGEYRHGRIHPATRTFQALRIAVNEELSRLPGLLSLALDVLAPNGKLGVITFHSLEDRIVKNYFRDMGKKCTCPPEVPICRCGGKAKVEVLTKKSVSPQEDEIRVNPPSRSARLRVVRKLSHEEENK
ncbi:MAG TPA: 16S rRNA (cytosine(1402)-N(4))-methyltransferase RsmH [Treponemataceae bacterium]|nr:16S rRNA (cytosine(1402)-N(4))-methyltransferase RsmH [Treponemataceae bacterium]